MERDVLFRRVLHRTPGSLWHVGEGALFQDGVQSIRECPHQVDGHAADVSDRQRQLESGGGSD